MNINGFWLGAALLMLSDYWAYNYRFANNIPNNLGFEILAAVLTIFFFGFAFQKTRSKR